MSHMVGGAPSPALVKLRVRVPRNKSKMSNRVGGAPSPALDKLWVRVPRNKSKTPSCLYAGLSLAKGEGSAYGMTSPAIKKGTLKIHMGEHST
jgi:hypothetical protein